MNKLKINPSVVGWGVGGVASVFILVLLVKWGWNSFFAEVLGLKYIGWMNAAALAFWIVLLVLCLVGGKEVGK